MRAVSARSVSPRKVRATLHVTPKITIRSRTPLHRFRAQLPAHKPRSHVPHRPSRSSSALTFRPLCRLLFPSRTCVLFNPFQTALFDPPGGTGLSRGMAPAKEPPRKHVSHPAPAGTVCNIAASLLPPFRLNETPPLLLTVSTASDLLIAQPPTVARVQPTAHHPSNPSVTQLKSAARVLEPALGARRRRRLSQRFPSGVLELKLREDRHS